MSTLTLSRPSSSSLRRNAPWLVVVAVLGVSLGIAAALSHTAAVAVAMLPAVAVLFLRPRWLPAVLVASAFSEAMLTGSLTVSRIVGPLALMIIVLALAGSARLRLPRRSVLISVALYCLWALASALWTVNPESGFSLGGTGYALASLGLSLIYMAATTMFVQTEGDLRRLAWVVWVMSTAAGLLSVGQFVAGHSRALGLSGDPNFFAAVQVVALPIDALLVSEIQRGRTRLLVLAGLGVTVGSIITSLSRGGILALAAVFVLLTIQPASTFFRTRARKRAFIACAVLGAIALTVASFSALSARASTAFTTADGGSGRRDLWLAALNGWQHHPLIGMGFGAFIGQSNQLLLQTPGVDFTGYALRSTGQYVHNAYLESLTELGVVGLVLFVLMLGTMIWSFLATARQAERAQARFTGSFSRALLLSAVGFAFTSMFLSTETQRMLWILLGLSVALPRVLAGAQQPAPEAPPANTIGPPLLRWENPATRRT